MDGRQRNESDWERAAEKNGEKAEAKKKEKNMDKEKLYLYWLSRIDGIGAVKTKKLLEYTGSFEAIYYMKKQDLERLPFLRGDDAKRIEHEKMHLEQRSAEYAELAEKNIRFIMAGEPEYPRRLESIYDMPMWLFVKGRLPDEHRPSVAVVGARSCTSYGRQVAEYLCRVLAENEIQTVSGLARGIDGASHRGTVNAQGASYAVLGSGVDYCYPRENLSLYHLILEMGGVISEYGPGEKPAAGHFPARNRIISGLADAVIVVEARKKSGSLITADQALEQGKEVFAVPGRVNDLLSEGCNGLIKQGAALLQSPEDILDFFRIDCKKYLKLMKKTVKTLAKTEKMVYSCLDSQPKHVEELIRMSRLPAGECMAALLKLELDGFILQPVNQYYVRKLE